MKRYWGFRIDTSARQREFLAEELEKGNLRQGWGYEECQNLNNPNVEGSARRNLSIKKNVKKGDILLVPDIKGYGTVAIVEAAEDFDSGYRFDRNNDFGDFGHVFPVKKCENWFVRNNALVSGDLRSSLRTPMRFWNMDHCAENIEELRNQKTDENLRKFNYVERIDAAISSVLGDHKDEIINGLFDSFTKKFSESDWEFVLTECLPRIYPNYIVERCGGVSEKNHGADILVKIPSPLDDSMYAVAIQVKDYEGKSSTSPVEQVNKADAYADWHSENLRLIEKWVVLTKASKENNSELAEKARESNVKILFADDLKELLYKSMMATREK